MSVFYEKFERHAGGAGLKGHATHYCPGCGHGLVHKFLDCRSGAIFGLDVCGRHRIVGEWPVCPEATSSPIAAKHA